MQEGEEDAGTEDAVQRALWAATVVSISISRWELRVDVRCEPVGQCRLYQRIGMSVNVDPGEDEYAQDQLLAREHWQVRLLSMQGCQ